MENSISTWNVVVNQQRLVNRMIRQLKAEMETLNTLDGLMEDDQVVYDALKQHYAADR